MFFILRLLCCFFLQTCTNGISTSASSNSSSEAQNNLIVLGKVYLGQGPEYNTYKNQQTSSGNFPLNDVAGIYFDVNENIQNSAIENFSSNCTISDVFNVDNNRGIIVYVTSSVENV